MTRNPRTEAEADLWFDRLATALQTTAIPDGAGNYRFGTADEFMLMDIEDGACGWSCARFKHRGTRNYLAVQHQAYTGTSSLSVLFAESDFLRGSFGAAE